MKILHAIPMLTLAVAVGVTALAAAEPAQPNPNAPAQYNPNELQVDKIQSPRDPASGQATGIQSPRDVASGQATSRQAHPTGNPPSSLVTEIGFPTAVSPAAGGPAASKWEGPDLDASRRDPASGQSSGASQGAQTANPQAGIYASNMGGGLLGVKEGQSNPSAGDGTPPPNRPNGYSLSSSTPGSTVVAPRDAASGQTASQASGYLKIEGVDGESKVAKPVASEQFIGGAGGDGLGIRREQSPEGMVFTNDTIDKIDAKPGATAQTYREGGVNDTTFRKKKPRRNRDGTRGKRQHKP